MQRARLRNNEAVAWMLCFLATGVSLVGFVSPQLSTVLSMLLAGPIIFWANPFGLPALAILWVRATDFIFVGGMTPQNIDATQQTISGALVIGGFPLSLQLFTMICITLRVLLEAVRVLLFSRNTRSKQQATVLEKARLSFPLDSAFALWLLFFGITLFSSFWGRSLGNENWTQSIRASFSLAAYFYGYMLSSKLSLANSMLKSMLWIIAIVLALVASALYWNHIAFFYVALGATAFWNVQYRRRSLLAVLLGFAAIATLFGPGDTLTILFLVVGGLFAGFFLFNRNQILGRRVTALWTALVIPLSFVAIVLVLLAKPSPSLWYTTTESSLLERFQFKLYEDRGSLWRAAWERIVEYPEIVSPAGRSLEVDNPRVATGYLVWKVHVHNSYLEILRQTGILGGFIFIVLSMLLWWRLRNTLLQPVSALLRIFGAAALLTIAVGATTGIFPFDFFVGPWVWLWAGIVVGTARIPQASDIPMFVKYKENGQLKLNEQIVAT